MRGAKSPSHIIFEKEVFRWIEYQIYQVKNGV